MVIIDGFKVNPNKKIIDNLEIQVLYIPLESKLGYSYKENVKVGDYVCIGSILGKNNIADTSLISSVSGTVVGFEDKYISNGKQVRCIVIETDFKEKYLDKIGKKNDITKYSKDEFISVLKRMSITSLSGSSYPTYIKYETTKKINYLIVNGCECDPYVSSDSARMYNNAEEILEAIDAIIEIMELDKAYIAINEKNDMVIKKFLKHINTYPNIKIYPIMDGYPNGYEKYLISEILNLKYNNIPEEVGVICENVSTIYAIYEALKYHKPLSDRIVTITGNGIKNPANYLLKIGSSLKEINFKSNIFKKVNNPLIISGGAMMGLTIPSEDFIITADVNCIIYAEDDIVKPTECIKCGKCSEVCPMNLIPSMIISNPRKSKELHIDRCIGCGLCSYVCPSKIEIREIINDIKEDKYE